MAGNGKSFKILHTRPVVSLFITHPPLDNSVSRFGSVVLNLRIQETINQIHSNNKLCRLTDPVNGSCRVILKTRIQMRTTQGRPGARRVTEQMP